MYHFSKISRGRPPQPLTLSDKQRTIVQLSMQGLSAKEIAVITGTNCNTTNRTFTHLLSRFNVRSSVALITKIIQLGLINPQTIEVKGR